MGFRNPFRIQVDENDVAYVTDYSPDSSVPRAVPRPGRHRPGGDRAQAGQLRLAALLHARPPLLPVGLQHVRRRCGETYECGNPARGPAEHLALEHRAAR